MTFVTDGKSRCEGETLMYFIPSAWFEEPSVTLSWKVGGVSIRDGEVAWTSA